MPNVTKRFIEATIQPQDDSFLNKYCEDDGARDKRGLVLRLPLILLLLLSCVVAQDRQGMIEPLCRHVLRTVRSCCS